MTSRLLFVHAHPDDETLATGGTMAHYAARPDVEVTLVTCTLGEQGEVIPPELAQLEAGQADQLGGYRIGELALACAALGVTDHRFLGGAGRWRDTGMALAGHGTRAALPEVLHPRAFAHPDAFADEVDALVEILEELRPAAVVTYAADGGYGHPDHVRAHDITVAAVGRVPSRLFHVVTPRGDLEKGIAELAGHVVPPLRLPEPDELPSVPDELVTTRVDVSAHRAARVAAMRAHATQVLVQSDGTDGPVVYSVSNLVAQPFTEVESFVAASGTVTAPHDLLAEGA
ncbi:N-acetyl-1-D-myo-inositol-2-amino-2-deoxy-alpha-D-glucopyranoside deacetylase [Pseudonocardia sp. CA-107938]|uniref:N-acetyl-1-D-myo-inositol-2-amino-2-deoxy-alpha- D-glucopyranoside deacetylase n=1 Tax=Pseudonocardia sp. CA-107938 TaxID=3240021 RepID=UPI003D89C87C